MNLFLLQLRCELQKLFARKRTYIGFGAFLLIETALLAMMQLPGPKRHFRRLIEQNGYVFDEYFSGLTLGLMILMWATFLLGALYLALVAGDVVSKEVEEGTLRMMLCRPVSRMRILLLKYAACIIYTFALMFFIGITALAAGFIYKGFGGLFVFAPLEKIFALYPFWSGLTRYLGCLPLLALSLTSITSLGFMFSCFNMKPAAATIVTLSIFFLDSILKNIPYFESLQDYFITARMSTWLKIFLEYPPWNSMVEDYSYLLAFNATFVVIGVIRFQERDFKG